MSRSSAFCILVVDDLLDNLALLQMALELEGYCVKTATDADSAMAQLKTALPDLILMDVMMPGLDGYEVARLIRQETRFAMVPIVLLSAYSNHDAAKSRALNIRHFVRKPINLDQLNAMIREILQAPALSSKRDRIKVL